MGNVNKVLRSDKDGQSVTEADVELSGERPDLSSCMGIADAQRLLEHGAELLGPLLKAKAVKLMLELDKQFKDAKRLASLPCDLGRSYIPATIGDRVADSFNRLFGGHCFFHVTNSLKSPHFIVLCTTADNNLQVDTARAISITAGLTGGGLSASQKKEFGNESPLQITTVSPGRSTTICILGDKAHLTVLVCMAAATTKGADAPQKYGILKQHVLVNHLDRRNIMQYHLDDCIGDTAGEQFPKFWSKTPDAPPKAHSAAHAAPHSNTSKLADLRGYPAKAASSDVPAASPNTPAHPAAAAMANAALKTPSTVKITPSPTPPPEPQAAPATQQPMLKREPPVAMPTPVTMAGGFGLEHRPKRHKPSA